MGLSCRFDRELGTVPRSGVRGFRADRLRELRVRAGFSADDLAAKVGATRQAVSTWETGRSTPPPATLGRIANALHTSVAALVPIPSHETKCPCPSGVFQDLSKSDSQKTDF